MPLPDLEHGKGPEMTGLLGAVGLNTSWYIALAALGLALIIGVPMAVRVIREAKGEVDPEGGTEEDLMGPLAEAYASGQMSEEEYNRIKATILRGGVDPAAFARIKPASLPARPNAENQGPSEGELTREV
jgi:uncharacterized membrane protein